MSSVLHAITASICLMLGVVFKFLPGIGCLLTTLFMWRTTRSVMKRGDKLCELYKTMIEDYDLQLKHLEEEVHRLEAARRSHDITNKILIDAMEKLKIKVNKLSNPAPKKKGVKKKETTK